MNTYRKSLYLIVLHKSYCVQRTNIQNLKAIHNAVGSPLLRLKLCSKNEYTKSESNSQLRIRKLTRREHCVQRTNIQNLKAIHNGVSSDTVKPELCSKNEYTKSESNSQLVTLFTVCPGNCVQRTNIQNLKAIHNQFIGLPINVFIVFKERIYKI